VHPYQGLAGIRTPMAEKPVLDVLGFQWFSKQRIRAKIDHSRREIIAGSPVGVHLAEFFRGKGSNFTCASHQISPANWIRAARSYISTLQLPSSDVEDGSSDLIGMIRGLPLTSC
jgi:hypothetical protein